MTRLFLLTCAISLVCFGCGNKNSAPPTDSAGANVGPATAGSQADLSATLAELTQVLRKFSVEQRKVPVSLNELVSAGYLPALPQPPSGKAFGIDTKNLHVIVK